MTTPTGSPRRLRVVITASVVVVTALVAWLLVDTARGVMIRQGERHGSVTVSGCTFLAFGRHVNSYSCTGEFVSDEGDLRVPVVTFTHTGSLDAGETVLGTVAGLDDGTVSIDSEFGLVWRLLAAAAGAAAVVYLVVRFVRLRPRLAGAG